MKTHHEWASSFVMAAASLVLTSNASAGTAQEEAAEMRFQEAKALMEQDNFAAACPKLVESQQLDPAVGTLLYLGECYARNGQTATAWRTFLAAADAAHSANQPPREKMARERANSMVTRLSKLIIMVPAEARVAGLEVKLDGAAMGEASWGITTALDPGEHLIGARAPDRKPWSYKIRILPGGVQSTIAVPILEPITAASAAPVPVQTSPDQNQNQSNFGPVMPAAPSMPQADSRPNDGSTQRVVGIAVGGVGVASLAVGTVFGLVARSKESQSEQYCKPTDNTSCQHPGIVLLDEAKRDAMIANVAFIVGSLELVTGAVLYATAPQPNSSEHPKQASNVRIMPLAAPTAAGLLVAGRF
jgi:hypothetical protein